MPRRTVSGRTSEDVRRTSQESKTRGRHDGNSENNNCLTMDMKSSDKPFGIAEQSSSITLAHGGLEACLETLISFCTCIHFIAFNLVSFSYVRVKRCEELQRWNLHIFIKFHDLRQVAELQAKVDMAISAREREEHGTPCMLQNTSCDTLHWKSGVSQRFWQMVIVAVCCLNLAFKSIDDLMVIFWMWA